jgi:hypothetical protein
MITNVRVITKTLLSVDPGKRKAGAALWGYSPDRPAGRQVTLIKAATLHASGPKALARAVGEWSSGIIWGEWVCERPRDYNGKTAMAKDLASLRLFLDSLVGEIGPSEARYFPSEWKGQTPKDIHQRRIAAAMDVFDPDWRTACWDENHDTIDAIGVGLYHLTKRVL